MLGAVALTPGRALGQSDVDSAAIDRPAMLPDGTRRVRGRVVTPRDSAMHGVPNAWVTLHRVAGDRAGPLDSVRTGADGAYAFTYRPSGAANAIYFVSAQYDGIAYFSPPLRDAVVTGERAEVAVFDTTSARVPATVRGRHVAVSRAAADGSRDVLEVYELSNDGERTAVPNTTSGAGVWSAALPAGAAAFVVRASGDVPNDGMTGTNGRAVLRTPLAPGIKQVAFSYRLASARVPFAVPVEAPTSVLEVLVEEPRGTAQGAGLVQAAPATLEGHTFHRYLAQDVPAGARVVVDVPAAPGDAWPRWALPAVLAGVGGAMTFGLLAAYRRRSGSALHVATPAVAPSPAPRTADALLAELAALDDAHAARAAAGGPGSSAETASYADARAELKRELAERLAAGQGAA
ncbi:hypothetical protein tb265_28060 [Gemmatimonadetes bacterium T265]|nr:hypothetical protein tb265_28060 [Gemmatimonadetes bacterium T265]